MSYRDDPRWQDARSRYVDEYPGVAADTAAALRIQASKDMCAVETEYEQEATPGNVEPPVPTYTTRYLPIGNQFSGLLLRVEVCNLDGIIVFDQRLHDEWHEQPEGER